MSKILLVAAVCAPFLLAAPAQASISLVTGLGDPASVVTGGTQVTFQGGPTGEHSTVTESGITFTADSGVFELSGQYSGLYNNQGVSLQGNFDGTEFQSLTITFAAPVGAFAFNYGAADQFWLLQAFDSGGNLMGGFDLTPVNATNFGTFYGLASTGIGISSARLFVDQALISGAAQNPDYIFVDNVTTGPVHEISPEGIPEPATWGMMIAGMGLVGAGLRRRAGKTLAA